MKTGIPQGSGLGPLLFLIYINDLPKCLNVWTKPDMFADDIQIATSSNDIKVITETLNRDLNNVANWLSANKLTMNNSKTEYMIIGSKKRLSQVTADPAISVGNLEIKRVLTGPRRSNTFQKRSPQTLLFSDGIQSNSIP
ncbi:Hypothetical predicted protein [Paramuricea clavata]|uniref:Uncharacterized protein n=1 Tax=Paramuricea clavata TaxID=317549 RepID=A0A6S7KJI0_PARCT|nr:Hypothetical predicted protein [Paramuricea clavata]